VAIILTVAVSIWTFNYMDNSVEGFNVKLRMAGYVTGDMALPYDSFAENQTQVTIDSATYFLDLNKMCWSFYATEYDGHWFKPAIFWEPHYADSNPSYDFWFSNGTTVFILYNWKGANVG
jgi:hypothetical protein